jgi:hypothetical protein
VRSEPTMDEPRVARPQLYRPPSQSTSCADMQFGASFHADRLPTSCVGMPLPRLRPQETCAPIHEPKIRLTATIDMATIKCLAISFQGVTACRRERTYVSAPRGSKPGADRRVASLGQGSGIAPRSTATSRSALRLEYASFGIARRVWSPSDLGRPGGLSRAGANFDSEAPSNARLTHLVGTSSVAAP